MKKMWNLYDGFQCAIEEQGKLFEWFHIKFRVKQGCNMLGVKFLIVRMLDVEQLDEVRMESDGKNSMT